MCVCVRVCVCARACACGCVCVRVCLCAYGRLWASLCYVQTTSRPKALLISPFFLSSLYFAINHLRHRAAGFTKSCVRAACRMAVSALSSSRAFCQLLQVPAVWDGACWFEMVLQPSLQMVSDGLELNYNVNPGLTMSVSLLIGIVPPESVIICC